MSVFGEIGRACEEKERDTFEWLKIGPFQQGKKYCNWLPNQSGVHDFECADDDLRVSTHFSFGKEIGTTFPTET